MKQIIEASISGAISELYQVDTTIVLTRPEEQFGDYATNVALQLTKQLGKNPRQIAEELAVKLRETFGDRVTEVSIAGPGFINLKLSDKALLESVEAEPAKSLQGQTMVAEYSDPNPFKVLHAGHLYTTLVGDAMANLLEHAGAKVHRLNYGGDVGLHAGKTMWAVLRALGGEKPGELEVVQPEQRLEWLSERYVEGNAAYENNEDDKAEIVAVNQRVYELHNKNDRESPFAQIYWTCRQWSYDGFKQFYERLRIREFERFVPESEVTPTGVELVKQGLDKGVFMESAGAVVFTGEKHGLHTRVFLNSKGLPTYEAKELGLAALKWRDYQFDQSVIITGNDIVEYMKVVLKALESFYPEVVPRSRHFTHGMVKLPGGVKMSSRLGNILRAEDILNAAAIANQQLTGQDNDDAVLGAVKYAFLKQRLGGDIIYDPEESVSLEGNSGPYLQYAHARARSIIAKAQGQGSLSDGLQPDERSLVRKIGEYAETVDRAVAELAPHHICTYLYELAQAFNRFYEHNRVIDDERQEIRLSLVGRYADTLKQGLNLLGIAAPDRM